MDKQYLENQLEKFCVYHAFTWRFSDDLDQYVIFDSCRNVFFHGNEKQLIKLWNLTA